MRSKGVAKNVAAGIVFQMVTVICGLVLPRIILLNFGSEYNGITASITQFLAVIELLKAGIGGVTKAALYKPLIENDTNTISVIVKTTEKFMHKVAGVFVLFILGFAAIYPVIVHSSFSWLFAFTLVLIIGIGTFAQYYFGITYQLLLMADQKAYIVYFIQIIATLLNTLMVVVIVRFTNSIHVVKLVSAGAFCLIPLMLTVYCRRHYTIDRTVRENDDLLDQRWDAFGQEVARFVNNNTDVMVITLIIGLNEVSVYTVYNAVIAGLRRILTVFFHGFEAAFGDMYARGEKEVMEESLRVYEVILYTLSSVMFATTMVMFIPYVILYTHGVTDINYIQPVFGMMMVLTGVADSFKMPYESIIWSAGKFRESRNASYAEAIINIVVSVALTFKLGIVGVAFGTVVSYAYRATWDAIFLSKNIIPRSILRYVGHVISTVMVLPPVYLISRLYMGMWGNTVTGWILFALLSFLVSLTIRMIINVVFYRNETKLMFGKVNGIIKKRRR